MLAFDTKFDNGKPASGTIQTFNDYVLDPNPTNCVIPSTTDPTVDPQPNAAYKTTVSTKSCMVVFTDMGF